MNKKIGDMTESELKDFIILLQEENSRYERKIKMLEDNWNELRKYIKNELILYFYNDKLPFEIIVERISNKMDELEKIGVSDVED